MQALDTNIIVRFLIRDDEKQAQIVLKRFKTAEAEKEQLFIPILVVLELIWVLESAYDLSRDAILNAIDQMRRMPILKFESDDVVERLLVEGKNLKTGLSDLLIAASANSSGCDRVLTFDRKASHNPLFQLL